MKWRPTRWRPRGWSSGLRTRTALAFALGAFGLSLLLSVITYQLARSSFVSQRRNQVLRQAMDSATRIRNALRTPGVDAQDALRRVRGGPEAHAFLEFPNRPRVGGTGAVVPGDIRRLVSDQVPAYQTIDSREGRAMMVAVPLTDVGAVYFELFSLRDISDNLRSLLAALAVAASLTTAGGAVLGSVVSGRVLRPLRQAAGAASEIAQGRLDTRLPAIGDTDLDPLVRSFNDMAASLQVRLEREARFASDVSHELRTPLTALSTAAQLLKGRRDELTERGQTALDVLVTQTEHFERLVLDLLEISRFDAGAAELHCDDVDVVELVTQVVHAVAPAAKVEADGLTDRVVNVDKRRIERILANLLQNAALYAGGATRVEISERAKRRLRLVVEDHGPGVPDDEKENVFERFRRGAGNQRGSGPKGTGLGLSLVAEHARLHGGVARVEDNPEGGARFIVELVTCE